MENAQNLDVLQSRPDPVGHDITGIGHHQLPGAVNTAGMAKGRIFREQVDGLDIALGNQAGRCRIFLRDVFGLVVEVLQHLVQSFNLHRHPTCPESS